MLHKDQTVSRKDFLNFSGKTLLTGAVGTLVPGTLSYSLQGEISKASGVSTG